VIDFNDKKEKNKFKLSNFESFPHFAKQIEIMHEEERTNREIEIS